MAKRTSIAALAVIICTIMVLTLSASAAKLGVISNKEIDARQTMSVKVGDTIKFTPAEGGTSLIWSGTVSNGLTFGDDYVVINADRLYTGEYERRYAERVYPIEGVYQFTAAEAGEYTVEIYNDDGSRTIYINVA